MKELILIRHAKTERILPEQQDYDRMLTERGHRQCKDLAAYLIESGLNTDLTLVSSAKRTYMTYQELSAVLNSKDVQFIPELYLAQADEIMRVILEHAQGADRMVIIGHNDGLSDLASYFLDDYFHISTSGYLHFQFEVDSWNYIGRGSGTLKDQFFSQMR
jgi:phosphohistidine phosphatase